MNTTEKLNRLSQMQAQADVIRLHFDDLRKSILTPEIQAQLDDIAAEERTSLDALQGGIDELTAEVKADVLNAGATVKGDYMMAVYNKGRVSWDTKGLDGFAIAHPEMAAFRKTGEPSITLRKI
jgi:hypothetical protein